MNIITVYTIKIMFCCLTFLAGELGVLWYIWCYTVKVNMIFTVG